MHVLIGESLFYTLYATLEARQRWMRHSGIYVYDGSSVWPQIIWFKKNIFLSCKNIFCCWRKVLQNFMSNSAVKWCCIIIMWNYGMYCRQKEWKTTVWEKILFSIVKTFFNNENSLTTNNCCDENILFFINNDMYLKKICFNSKINFYQNILLTTSEKDVFNNKNN